MQDILDFSKLEAGRLALESQPFKLMKCVDHAMNLAGIRRDASFLRLNFSLEPEANKKGIELNREVGKNVPEIIEGDSQRLRQVLMNTGTQYQNREWH